MKIDLHTHSYYSKDGISSPENLIKAALKKGLDGIALTDHETTRGWRGAEEAAERQNAVLILGEEMKIKKGGQIMGEILGYFLKEEINPEKKTIEEIINEIKKQGGLAIVAHPFNWRRPFLELDKYKNLIDGIEVFNARSQTKKGNKNAFDFAQKNNLVITAGSDAHSGFEVGSAYVEVKASSLEEFKEAILKKEVKILGRQSPIFVQIFATIGRTIHYFWRPKF